jgi:ankyrin repeat protein
VFDRILARGFPLHCAVLNRDTEAVKTLLKRVSDVNALDSGGRTALHLIAAQGPGDYICEKITRSLLGHGATVDTKDMVLQWIPLLYARKTKNKFVEDLLPNRFVR